MPYPILGSNSQRRTKRSSEHMKSIQIIYKKKASEEVILNPIYDVSIPFVYETFVVGNDLLDWVDIKEVA